MFPETSREAPQVDIRDSQIDRIFDRFNQCHLPGAAVGIAHRGRPVYRRAFGLANMELPVVLTTSIRMRIGSISKHFTALAYMLLCEAGKARIDDPIGKYLPELNPVNHAITMRQLMGHTGGLRDAIDIGLQLSGPGRVVTASELLTLYRDIDNINTKPGVAWNYNNGGYLILSMIIERIAGCSLEEYLQERIFYPVGMYDTLLRRFDTDFCPTSASTHMMNAKSEFEKSSYGTDFAGGGGVVSSIDDMLRWMAQVDRPVVGKPRTWSAMTTPLRLTNGASTGYALGLACGRYRGINTLGHSGGWMGGSAHMLKVPNIGLDIVVIVNREGALGLDLVHEVLDACIPDLDATPFNAQASCIAGTFLSEESGLVVRLFGDPGRQRAALNGFDIPFYMGQGGILRPAPHWGYLRQAITPIGELERPSAVMFDDFGNKEELMRVEDEQERRLSESAGVYRCDCIGAEIRLEQAASGAMAITTGRFGSTEYALRSLSERVWEAAAKDSDHWGCVLVLSPDRRSLRLSTWNTRGLAFRRVDVH